MKDIYTPLRTLIYGLITGQGHVCYEAGAIPVGAETPYVIIADINNSENSNKSDFGNSIQVLLDVVTSYNKNQIGNSKTADTIAGSIFEVINSKIQFEIFDGLQIVTTKILQDQKLNSRSENKVIYRRLIRFQQLIMEV